MDYRGPPGPWREAENSYDYPYWIDGVIEAEDGNLAFCYAGRKWPAPGEQEALAALLPNAYRLLEALGSLLPVMALADSHWRETPEFIEAEAALAAALGTDHV